jgi:transposase
MKQTAPTGTAEQHIRDIRRQTRKKYSSEEKIRIVLSGLRSEHSVAELCRREGIAESLYYAWSKDFLEAGRKRLSGDSERQATICPTSCSTKAKIGSPSSMIALITATLAAKRAPQMRRVRADGMVTPVAEATPSLTRHL